MGKKEEHGGKEEEGKKKKSKILQNNKVGAHIGARDPFTTLWILGLEAVATTKTQFVFFFLLKLKALALQTLFSLFFSN